MSKEKFWVLAISYTLIVFILNNVLETRLGAILMQLSYYALIFLVLGILLNYFRKYMRQIKFNHKNKLK